MTECLIFHKENNATLINYQITHQNQLDLSGLLLIAASYNYSRDRMILCPNGGLASLGMAVCGYTALWLLNKTCAVKVLSF